MTGGSGAGSCCDSGGRGKALGRFFKLEEEDEVCARGREGEVEHDGGP